MAERQLELSRLGEDDDPDLHVVENFIASHGDSRVPGPVGRPEERPPASLGWSTKTREPHKQMSLHRARPTRPANSRRGGDDGDSGSDDNDDAPKRMTSRGGRRRPDRSPDPFVPEMTFE
eukprot:TRINITY_DN5631_c0_g1_i2.p3 TRINITY_DN5631_c0_g1~~TRINITY_DN5631_c0_g1_i2.p3  ORF type:complete len:120 (+),score=54.28 TRINITY_DN5631_c0_g1_i2:220-579(+)